MSGTHPAGRPQEPPGAPNRGGRAWMGLRCLNGRHEACKHRLRCECECHLLITGGLRLHMEPA